MTESRHLYRRWLAFMLNNIDAKIFMYSASSRFASNGVDAQSIKRYQDV